MSKRNKISGLVFQTVIAAASAIFLAGCTGSGASAPRETPTAGNIKISADESFKPIVDSQVAVFTGLYKEAFITPNYEPETDLIRDFLNDSIQVIITSWALNEDQMKLFKAKLIEPRTTVIAWDALALIINRQNSDSLLLYKNIEDIFTGKVTSWKQLNEKSKLGNVSVIFDNEKSGNIRYFKEKFKIEGNLPSNFYAVNSNPEVVDYVSKTPNSLGIVSVNWISDHEDSLSMSFVKKIRVVGVSSPYYDTDFYYPLQGSIYDKSYPYIREIRMITRETFYGLGSGFISFVASEQGQRIILKSGLLPATMPIRIIEIKKQ